MNKVPVKCPVCGEYVDSIEVGYTPTNRIERRYQHTDHYFYLDLPFMYSDYIHDKDGLPILAHGLLRRPKVLSDCTVKMLSSLLGDSEGMYRERLSVHLAALRDESRRPVSWSEIIRVFLQGFLDDVIIKEQDIEHVKDVFHDEGYDFRDGKLQTRLTPIEGTEMRPRSTYVRRLKDLYMNLRKLYTHYFVLLLAAKTEASNYALAAWIILTPDQMLEVGSYEPKGKNIVFVRKLAKLESLHNLIDQIEAGQLVVDKQVVLLEIQGRGGWSDAGPGQHAPQRMRQRKGMSGYGIVYNTGIQIGTLMNRIGVDPMRFINQGDQRFYSFEEFCVRVLGERVDLGRNVLVYLLAPYWTEIIEPSFPKDAQVLVRWSAPVPLFDDIRPILRVLARGEWKTFAPENTDITDRNDIYVTVQSIFSSPALIDADSCEFVLEHDAVHPVDELSRLCYVNIGASKLRQPLRNVGFRARLFQFMKSKDWRFWMKWAAFVLLCTSILTVFLVVAIPQSHPLVLFLAALGGVSSVFTIYGVLSVLRQRD